MYTTYLYVFTDAADSLTSVEKSEGNQVSFFVSYVYFYFTQK